MKKILTVLLSVLLLTCLSGCAWFNSWTEDISGDIVGNTYRIEFYSNHGEKFMTMSGSKINMSANVVKEPSYSSEGGWGYVQTMSSVTTITIDGSQVESCGSTIIFAEDNLQPDVNFQAPEVIESTAEGFADNTIIADIVNRYKNAFGKPVVVVIQSQLGDPITAYSGNSVYWEVCENLPKTTKLMVDGKALYIHRANFQIIDKDLLD